MYKLFTYSFNIFVQYMLNVMYNMYITTVQMTPIVTFLLFGNIVWATSYQLPYLRIWYMRVCEVIYILNAYSHFRGTRSDVSEFFTQYTRMEWLYKYTCGLFRLNMHTTLHTRHKFRPHDHKNVVHVCYDPWECESVYGFLNIEYA